MMMIHSLEDPKIMEEEVVAEVVEAVVVDMCKTITMETDNGNIKAIEATKRFMRKKNSIFN